MATPPKGDPAVEQGGNGEAVRPARGHDAARDEAHDLEGHSEPAADEQGGSQGDPA